MKLNRNELTGVVMAGGKSSRMGTDKGLILFKGKPLAQYAIDRLLPYCSSLLISTQNELYQQFGSRLVPDEVSNCGPIGGIYSTLKTSETPWILVLGCDMPLVSIETIECLLQNTEGYDCVVPRLGNQLEPLCAVYSKSMLETIGQQITNHQLAMHALILKSKCLLIDFDSQASEFRNFNTPTELENS